MHVRLMRIACPAACPPSPAPLQEVAQQSGLEVQPTPQTMRVIQDKYVQKQHFQVGWRGLSRGWGPGCGAWR